MSAKSRARLRRQVHYRHRGGWNRRCAKEHDQLTARSCARVAKWMTDSIHSCETCDEHAARCANFAAWMAVRKTAQS